MKPIWMRTGIRVNKSGHAEQCYTCFQCLKECTIQIGLNDEPGKELCDENGT